MSIEKTAGAWYATRKMISLFISSLTRTDKEEKR